MANSHMFLLCAVAGILIIVLIVNLKRKYFSYPYKKNDFLFTKAESKFYSILTKSLGHEFLVMGKVRIADVISVEHAISKSHWYTSFNKIACKHFDYVILDRRLKILAVVELDDSSHDCKERQKRDVFVDKVCHAAKLPILHIMYKQYYMPDEIKRTVYDVLNKYR